MTENLDLTQLREQSTFDVAAMRGEKLATLIDRMEAAEHALDFHTQRDRELKALLSMIADRLDEFCYDELASLIEDSPLDQWGENYKSRLEAAEAKIERVREALNGAPMVPQAVIRRILDGGDQT